MTGINGTPANLGVRIAARVIDGFVVAAIDLGLGWVIGFGYDWLLLAAGIVFGYFAVLDSAAGTTAGKRLFRLRVVDQSGSKPSLRQALVRECFTLLGAVPFAGPLLALAAWIWIAITIRSNPLRQGKHDQLAGTRIVREGT